MSQEETQTTEQTQETVEGLNINDLNTLRAIIDLASSRGAFKPNRNDCCWNYLH